MHPVEVAADALIRHRWIEYLVALCRVAVPLAQVQHIRARLRYLSASIIII